MLLATFTVLCLLAISNARPNGVAPLNVVVVPPNCPPGQVLVNGQCRDVWRLSPAPMILPKLLIPSPAHNAEYVVDAEPRLIEDKGIITVPTQCPTGYKLDALGICRPLF